MLERLGGAADVGGHDRRAGGHRFEQDVRERFVQRRHHRHIHRRQQRRHIVSKAGEDHAIADAEALRALRELLEIGHVVDRTRLADDEKANVGMRGGDNRRRVQKILDALQPVQPRHHGDQPRVVGHAERPPHGAGSARRVEAAEVDAVRNHGDARRRESPASTSQLFTASAFTSTRSARRHTWRCTRFCIGVR